MTLNCLASNPFKDKAMESDVILMERVLLNGFDAKQSDIIV